MARWKKPTDAKSRKAQQQLDADLDKLADNTAGSVIADKVAADNEAHIAPGLWVGMILSMLTIPLSIAASFIGGFVLRHGGWRRVLTSKEPSSGAIQIALASLFVFVSFGYKAMLLIVVPILALGGGRLLYKWHLRRQDTWPGR